MEKIEVPDKYDPEITHDELVIVVHRPGKIIYKSDD